MSLAVARRRDLAAVVERRDVLVCTGAGGVGKTTCAAALALAAAEAGRRTLVLTIDPARRLAQALGVQSLDNTPRPVTGVAGLDAMMLDMKRTFDEVIARHAGDPARARRITGNRFYQQMSDSMAGTQEYMAMEKLYEVHAGGAYDCIVVDTPPTRNALDFLDAPRRLTDFLEGRFLKMFVRPGMTAGRTFGRAVGLGAGVFMRAASRITGAGVLGDLGEFFQSFDGMYTGFKQRAAAVYTLLGHPGTAFVVVTTPDPPALREAVFFLRRLEAQDMPTAGLVVNRMTPAPGNELVKLDRRRLGKAARLLDEGDDDQRAAAALLRLYGDTVDTARRERAAVDAALAGLDPRVLVGVPLLASDVHDLEGLRVLRTHLLGNNGNTAL